MTVGRAAVPCLFDLDLDEIPYTVPFSRLLVRAVGGALTVYRAAYEQSMDDSILASLVITDADGGVLPVIAASPYGIELSHHVGLVVTPHDTVHVGPLPPAFSCEINFRLPPQHIRLADRILVPTDATVRLGRDTVGVSLPTGGDLAIVSDDRMPAHRTYVATAADVSSQVTAWLTRCPVVDTRWRALVQLCWWVLGSTSSSSAPSSQVAPWYRPSSAMSACGSGTRTSSPSGYATVTPSWPSSSYASSCPVRGPPGCFPT